MYSNRPQLYWISGSPPSWRVMLGLVLKGVPFCSRRLNHDRGENRAPAYLKLNPLGQVPTLRHGDVVIRESIAILAYLDRAWPEAPIFGSTPEAAARIWQQVMVFEAQLRDPAGFLARSLIRNAAGQGDGRFDAAARETLDQFRGLEVHLSDHAFTTSEPVCAADAWLFPLMGWLDRAMQITDQTVPNELSAWRQTFPNLDAWHQRFAALPGVKETFPPHWAP